MDTFAKLFNVGGNGRQLLVFREHDEDRDETVMHHVTVAYELRIDSAVRFCGETQESQAQKYLERIDQDAAEGLCLTLWGLVEGGEA